ncbi:MAG: N-glycosylase/DNA lyase [Patescibacteria group bacterium]
MKFDSHKENFIDYNKLKRYYENMSELNKDLARIFSQKLDAKTITFAVKMFGYASRIVHKNIIFYPSNITIPIDSRLIKIYEKYT